MHIVYGCSSEIVSRSSARRLNWAYLLRLGTIGVCYTNSSVGSAGQIGTSSTTNYDDSTATPGTIYNYWVRATDGSNVSSFSSSDTGYCGSTNTSLPVASDFDGDGLADPAIYNTNGTWKIKLSSAGYNVITISSFLGSTGYIPAAADFDGDRKADPAIYGEDNGYWIFKLSSIGYAEIALTQTLGGAGYIPVPTDYDGDGLADPAVKSKTGNEWILMLSTGGYTPVHITLLFE